MISFLGLVIYCIKKIMSDFLYIKCDRALVCDIVNKNFTFSPDKLKALPDYGKILLPLNHLPSSIIPNDVPPYLTICYKYFLTKVY